MAKAIKTGIGLLFILGGLCLFLVSLFNPVAGSEDRGRTFVSSFVVDGVDQGAGYFYNANSVSNPEYHFIGESGEDEVYFEIDTYTIDTAKQQEADQNANDFGWWLAQLIIFPSILFVVGFTIILVN